MKSNNLGHHARTRRTLWDRLHDGDNKLTDSRANWVDLSLTFQRIVVALGHHQLSLNFETRATAGCIGTPAAHHAARHRLSIGAIHVLTISLRPSVHDPASFRFKFRITGALNWMPAVDSIITKAINSNPFGNERLMTRPPSSLCGLLPLLEFSASRLSGFGS
jgi:hypothetical protein